MTPGINDDWAEVSCGSYTNNRYRFPVGARRFVNDWNSHGPAHHCAVGIGQLADKIKKLGQLLEIETARVC